MADLKKVSSGEKLKIPASTYNVFIDTAQDYLKRQNKQMGGESGTPLQSKFVLVKNTTGSAVGRFGVLGISNSELSVSANYFKQNIILTGVAPSSTSHSSGRFVVLHEPIAASGVGRAYINGHCQVQINVTDANHTFCDVKNGDSTMLQSAESGPAVIIWKESGTGTKWAIIRFGGSGGGDTSSQVWAEIMHEPDDQSDHYDIKVTTWADPWASNTWYWGADIPDYVGGATYNLTPANSKQYCVRTGTAGSYKYYKCVHSGSFSGAATWAAEIALHPTYWTEFTVSIVRYEIPAGQWREFTCSVSHLSLTTLTPTNANYWAEIDATKAYLYGVSGFIHTTIPQFKYGDKVVVTYKSDDQKYYIIGAFTQGGVPIDGSQYLMVGSIGWIRGSGVNVSRAGAFFR